jgi:hypothetical protein
MKLLHILHEALAHFEMNAWVKRESKHT